MRGTPLPDFLCFWPLNAAAKARVAWPGHSAVRFFDLCFLVSLGFLLWGGAVKGGAGALEIK